MEHRVGLVLTGGGGKGAYHIGVWKALKEFGIDKNVTDISGTSVGALNTVMFAQGDYDLAEHLWTTISHDKILRVKQSIIAQIILKSRFNIHVSWLKSLLGQSMLK